mgnify:CR=1 FL=1
MSNQNPFITPNKEYMKAGINENVVIKEFRYEFTEKYEACVIVYGMGEATMKDMIFPVKPEYANPLKRKNRETGEEEEETKDEAINRNWGYKNNKLRSIITNFVTDAQLDEAMNKAKPATYKEAIEVYVSLLPADFSTRKGRLFTWYKKNGFLEVPDRNDALVGKRLFTLDPENNMTISYAPNQSKLTRPAPLDQANTATADVATTGNADDLPWG